jgi:hypothetical protein
MLPRQKNINTWILANESARSFVKKMDALAFLDAPEIDNAEPVGGEPRRIRCAPRSLYWTTVIYQLNLGARPCQLLESVT